MSLPGLLQDAQGVVGPLPFAVELDPPGQPVILYLAGWEAGRGRGGRSPQAQAVEAQRGGDREGRDKQERERDQGGPQLKEKDNVPAKEGRWDEEAGRGQRGGAEESQEGRGHGKEEEEAQRKQERGGVGSRREGRGATGRTQ